MGENMSFITCGAGGVLQVKDINAAELEETMLSCLLNCICLNSARFSSRQVLVVSDDFGARYMSMVDVFPFS
jgi:hypothetical protein